MAAKLDPNQFAIWFTAIAERWSKNFSQSSIAVFYGLLDESFQGDTQQFVGASKRVLRELNNFPSVEEWTALKPRQSLPSNHYEMAALPEDWEPCPPPPEVKAMLQKLFASRRGNGLSPIGADPEAGAQEQGGAA